MVADLPDIDPQPFPLVVADPSEYVEQINQYGHVQYWNTVTGECSNVPVKTITSIHFGIFMSMFLMSSAPKSFFRAILNPFWHPPILKELDNFCENTCFQWIPDIGQRRLWMIFLPKLTTASKLGWSSTDPSEYLASTSIRMRCTVVALQLRPPRFSLHYQHSMV